MMRFVTRYLYPASRLGEILFGLIMVLTVTLIDGLKVAEPHNEAGSEPLFCGMLALALTLFLRETDPATKKS